MRKGRNIGVEAYRILLTFGICYLHAMTTCGYSATGVGGRISYLLYSCVVGFVFITGWFGISFSIIKLLKLWGVALYAVVVVAVIDSLLHGYAGFRFYYGLLIGNWFINGYTVLMLMAPALNYLVKGVSEGMGAEKRGEAINASVLILVLVFGWAFLKTFPHVSRWIPFSAGIEAYSGITLVGIYLAARLAHVLNVESRITPMRLSLLLGVSLIAIMCHLSSYASPFAFCLAMLGFFIFKKITIGARVARLILFLAPTTFPIFFLHANRVGFSLMSDCETYLQRVGFNDNIVFLITGFIAFVVAFLLDVPRRFSKHILMCFRGVKKNGSE